MEQIYMIEVFVKKIVLKIEPYKKDAWEIEQEELERKREEERLAALEALKKPKKAKPPKPPKKGKGKKEPPGPSEEELKFMQACTMQVACLPIFDFYIAHDNFIAPPPPPPPEKKGKKKPKPKKKKKNVVEKRALPSEPLPQYPYLGVGNSIIFVSRPTQLEDILRKTPLYITTWNKDENFECTGFCKVHWHESFFEVIKKSMEYNPINMEQGQFRDTHKPYMFSNTVEYVRPLQCEEDLVPSGMVEFYLRLTCLGNKVVTYFVSLPEMERLPGRKYLTDEMKIKDLEVVRHWEGTDADSLPPVAYFFGGVDITKSPQLPIEPIKIYDDFVAPYTNSELAILAMGFPKGPCGGTNCPKRMEYRGSQHQFIPGEYVKCGKEEKYEHGRFVNKRDIHGPCGRLDCPLAKRIRAYICNEGAYKTCRKPCPKDYY